MTSDASVSSQGTGSSELRMWLQIDAVVTGVNALAYLVAAPLVVDLLGSTEGIVRGIGAFLLLFTLVVVAAAARAGRTPGLAWAVVAGNAIWTVVSLAVVVMGSLELTTAGSAWAVAQAVVVGGLAALQLRALR
ncbi:hypothetical protein CLV56_0311 [Mumia flava]|uniref:Integral membrane protein n=1 Tax=Mumia flava TaxID=1348852 RepID=A0A0B2B381_9ACTN|nr:hypothetical protein [Mumia flava]PJJ56107.1 hypothetical protein CLV56_0311 [Mumia flava]